MVAVALIVGQFMEPPHAKVLRFKIQPQPRVLWFKIQVPVPVESRPVPEYQFIIDEFNRMMNN